MRFIIEEKENGITVKDFLFKKLRLTVAAVKRVKYRENGITVNGENVTVRYILKTGDTLVLLMEDTEEDENEYTVPVDIPIETVLEDDSFVVVSKPPFMPSHPSLGHKDDTVANALAFKYKDKPFVFRPVNRLDRDTSGLMLIAKGKVSAGRLYFTQQNKEIEKSYIAILEGIISPPKGTIETYMCREEGSIVKRRVCDESYSGAKNAVTEYETIAANEKACVVKATPVTGRTHQLRVHFAHVGCPIYGDTMYGNFSEYIDRQALHAYSLSFPHPAEDKKVSITAKLPDDMQKLLEILDLKIPEID